MRVYIETNFVAGTAFGREENAVRLLSLPIEKARLCFPEVCLMEAFSAFEDEQKRRNRFSNELQQQINDVTRRNQLLNAPPLLAALQAAFVSNLKFANDTTVRMEELAAQLFGLRQPFAGAEFLSLQPTYEPNAFSQIGSPPEIRNQPTDTLILRVVCADALRHPNTPKAFLSGNTRDFNTDEVRDFLTLCGLRYFATTDALMGWLDSGGAESAAIPSA